MSVALSTTPAFEIRFGTAPGQVIKIYANGKIEGAQNVPPCTIINRIPRLIAEVERHG